MFTFYVKSTSLYYATQHNLDRVYCSVQLCLVIAGHLKESRLTHDLLSSQKCSRLTLLSRAFVPRVNIWAAAFQRNPKQCLVFLGGVADSHQLVVTKA